MANAAPFLPAPQTHSMPLLAHLEELRKRIIFSVLGVLVGFLSCWSYADRIFGLMQQPVIQALRHHGLGGRLVYLSPTEPFNLYLEVGFAAGLFAVSPFVFYQLWLFIAPGLYRHEKRYALPFLLSTVGLFIAGGFFGYRMVYPASLDVLISYGQRFQPMITIGEYTKLFVTIIIGLGFFPLRYRVYQLRSTLRFMRLVIRLISLAPVARLLGRVRNGSRSTGTTPLDLRKALRKAAWLSSSSVLSVMYCGMSPSRF